MSDTFTLGLDGLTAGDPASEETLEYLNLDDLSPLAQHHSAPDGSHSYIVAHDESAMWGAPGTAALRAIAVARDLDRGTFTLETSEHSTMAFAQHWLVEHGCPPEQIARLDHGVTKPHDDLTVQIEQQIRESGKRYEVLDHYSSEEDQSETWTVVRDRHAAEAPVRTFLEELSEAGTYTVREGAFADEDAANSWLEDREDPLPEPPEYTDDNGAVVRARIARIALTRSLATAAAPASGPETRRAPSAPDQRPSQGRTL